MTYDLDAIESDCVSLGIVCHRVASDQIDLVLAADCILQFSNQASEGDTMVGFSDTPWHSHDKLMVMTGDSTCIECSELDIVRLIASGDLVIVSQIMNGQLTDRWLAHKAEPLDLQHIEAGEELRINTWHNKTDAGNGSYGICRVIDASRSPWLRVPCNR